MGSRLFPNGINELFLRDRDGAYWAVPVFMPKTTAEESAGFENTKNHPNTNIERNAVHGAQTEKN